MPGFSQSLTAKLLLLGAASIATLVDVELFLRAELQFDPIPKMFRPNPQGTGSYRLKPSLDLSVKLYEDRFSIRTNSRGMRNAEVSPESRDGRERIAFVGDSFTFGMWANREDCFVGTFESRLLREKYEVLNFGTPSYGLGDIELQLQEQVLAFQPKHLFVCSFISCDLWRTFVGPNMYDAKALEEGRLFGNAQRFRERFPLELLPESLRGEREQDGESFLPEFHFLQLAKKVFEPADTRPARWTYPVAIDRSCVMLNTFWCQKPYPEMGQKCMTHYREVLDRIRNLCERQGIRIYFLFIPNRDQIEGEPEAGEDFDLGYPQRLFEPYLESRGIPSLDPMPQMREATREGKRSLFVKNEGHYNPRGHKIVGDLLAEFFHRQMSTPQK